MISIICPVTDNEVYQTMLLDSLQKQTDCEYEVIQLNSKELGFDSASETLNYGVSISKGDVLLFVHQDIEFLDDSILNDIDNYCKTFDFAIAGVCGVIGTGEYKVASSVTIGPTHRQAGRKILQPEESFVLDECLLIVKREKFNTFDNIGSTWHFYAVDYCLGAKERGEKVMLFPLPIYHLSPGWSLNYDYFNRLKTLGKKHNNLKYICTCMGVFRNNWTLPVYCSYRKFKIFVKKILHYDKKV